MVVPKRTLSEDDYEISNRKIYEIENGMMLTITYYDKEDYVQKTGRAAKISFDEAFLQIVKTKIPFKNITDIQGDMMDIFE